MRFLAGRSRHERLRLRVRNGARNHVRAPLEVRLPRCDDPRIPDPGPARRSQVEAARATRAAEHDGGIVLIICGSERGTTAADRDGRIEPAWTGRGGCLTARLCPDGPPGMAPTSRPHGGGRRIRRRRFHFWKSARSLECCRASASRSSPSCQHLTGQDVWRSRRRIAARRVPLCNPDDGCPHDDPCDLCAGSRDRGTHGRPRLGGPGQYVSEHVAGRPGGDSPRGRTRRGQPDRQDVAGGQHQHPGLPGGLSPSYEHDKFGLSGGTLAGYAAAVAALLLIERSGRIFSFIRSSAPHANEIWRAQVVPWSLAFRAQCHLAIFCRRPRICQELRPTSSTNLRATAAGSPRGWKAWCGEGCDTTVISASVERSRA